MGEAYLHRFIIHALRKAPHPHRLKSTPRKIRDVKILPPSSRQSFFRCMQADSCVQNGRFCAPKHRYGIGNFAWQLPSEKQKPLSPSCRIQYVRVWRWQDGIPPFPTRRASPSPPFLRGPPINFTRFLKAAAYVLAFLGPRPQQVFVSLLFLGAFRGET